MTIKISQLKYYFISVDQARYSKFAVVKYLDTATINKSGKYHKTTFSHDMI